MSDKFLYEDYDAIVRHGFLNTKIPDFIVENLNPDFKLRDYQIEAFARFLNYQSYETPERTNTHLLFNMATGSGKTLIMAGLILYLYEQGYRNFLFFVNSTNIIEKTKDNFLNNLSNKYLFNQKIFFRNKQVKINKVDNFDGVSDKDINICFTTMQKLHGDLHNEKENSITIEDFKDHKIVLISDEAHHGQVQTKNIQKEIFEKPNWENTVIKIFTQSPENILLEFTATVDYQDKNIVEKYRDKIIFRYELKEFRDAGYSKDVELLHTDTDRPDRILQAIILSQYRQEVSSKHGIYLKPVILFKAQNTIAQSEENKKLFHEIIDNLSVKDIDKIRKQTDVEVLQKAFQFFKNNKITDSILVKKLRDGFAENKCLSVNEEREKEEYQLLLNSLEDKNNQIRAIFAVQKLNEGWDVLNLFDIVRLYETRDGKANKPGKTTISEAQLIGRGARYWPFALNDEQDKYKRKYDEDLKNELRILEELHYHTHHEVRYISEIRTALKEKGLIDENEIEVELKLKEIFKNSDFYKKGIVYDNERRKRSYEKVKKIEDLGVTKKNITYNVLTGAGKEVKVFDDEKKEIKDLKKSSKDISLTEIQPHVIKNALARNEFFTFESLNHYFPELKSINEFIDKEMSKLNITFRGKDLDNLSNTNKFHAVLALLEQIEKEIKENLTEYVGTKFEPKQINTVFSDKKIKIKKDSEKLDGQKDLVADKDWYAFDANYGTSEEKDLVVFMNNHLTELKKHFKEAYLIRNERQLKLFNFNDGQTFEPDFLLFLLDKNEKGITYQLFIEPKGEHLKEHDQWKEDFLKEITEKYKGKVLTFTKTKKYKIIGLPFYNSANENEFKEHLFTSIQ
ncbi:MAG: DEAD/DEAH box helicase family protein [Patescibacteria group bacterium]